MKKRFCVVIFFWLSILVATLFSQDNSLHLPLADDIVLNNSSLGREFWIAIPQNEVLNGNLRAHGVEIVITSPYTTTVTMEIPNLGLKKTKKVEAYKLTSFSSEDNDVTYAQEVTESETVTQKGIHLVADKPFAAWVINSKRYSAEGYQAVPVANWGKEYRHCSYYDFYESRKARGGGFIIIASESGTRITVNLKGVGAGQTVNGKRIGQTITATLNAGNTFMVRGDGSTRGQFDISGTEIIASKPVGVISFHMRTMIPSICPEDRDNLNEMLSPVKMWGKSFNTVQLDRHPQGSRNGKGDLFRIVNKEQKTTVDCEFYDIASYQKVGNRTLPMNQASMFGELDPIMDINNSNQKKSVYGMATWTSDKPIQLIQNAFSNRWDGDKKWSPMSIIVPPLKQYIRSAVFCTPLNTGFQEHQLTLIAHGNPQDPDNSPIRSIKLDGEYLWKKVPQILQNRIPGTEYYWIRTNVTTGAHYIQSETKLYAYLVGFDAYNAYGYPIAQGFNIIEDADTSSPKVEKVESCGNYILTAKEINNGLPGDNPRQVDAGLSKIILIEDYSYNYEMTIDKPENFKPQNRITIKEFYLKLSDNTKAAKAVYAVMDRAGNITIDSVSYDPPNIEFTPEQSIDFGKVRLTASKNDTVCIKNLSLIDYKIFNLVNFNDKFVINNPPELPYTLQLGDSLILDITYTPGYQSPEKVDQDSLIIDSDCVDFVIQLSGRVIYPTISVEKTFDFGKVEKGEKLCMEDVNGEGLKITNTGSDDLTVYAIEDLELPFFLTSPTEPLLPAVIKPNESISLKSICFIPQDSGRFSSTATVKTDAVEGDSIISFSGLGYIKEDPSSVREETNKLSIEVSPNPVSGILTIKWNTFISSTEHIDILNSAGILVDRIVVKNAGRELEYSTDNLPTGIYLLRFITEYGIDTKKIIVLH